MQFVANYNQVPSGWGSNLGNPVVPNPEPLNGYVCDVKRDALQFLSFCVMGCWYFCYFIARRPAELRVSPLSHCPFTPSYDLFAINRVLPTVPRIRLSCILCTWFPLRRSEDRGHSIRWVTSHPALDRSLW